MISYRNDDLSPRPLYLTYWMSSPVFGHPYHKVGPHYPGILSLCVAFLCVFYSIEASGFFPLLIKDCSKLFWQNSLSSHFFYKNIAKVSLRVSENSYSQKQCSQHHSVSFLQIFTKGFEWQVVSM